MINLTPIIQALLALMAALITYRLIPWIKERTTASQQANIRAAVKVLVFAAEQLYGAGNGPKKLQYVRDRLREQGFDVDTDEIEAAVAEYLNSGIAIGETVEAVTESDCELPPLDEWPLEMIVNFCRLNDIPCEGCQTKDEYIRAITQAGNMEPPDAEETQEQKQETEEPVETEETEG